MIFTFLATVTLTFDLLTPKALETISLPWPIILWSLKSVGWKELYHIEMIFTLKVTVSLTFDLLTQNPTGIKYLMNPIMFKNWEKVNLPKYVNLDGQKDGQCDYYNYATLRGHKKVHEVCMVLEIDYIGHCRNVRRDNVRVYSCYRMSYIYKVAWTNPLHMNMCFNLDKVHITIHYHFNLSQLYKYFILKFLFFLVFNSKEL